MRRDALALSIALNATLIMPRLVCTCDRYWGFLENCRMPTGPEDMPLPFHCPQDARIDWCEGALTFTIDIQT